MKHPGLKKKHAFIALLLGKILLGVLGIALFMVYYGYQSSMKIAIPIATVFAGALIMMLGSTSLLLGKFHGGKIILDISPIKNRNVNILMMVIFLANGIIWTFDPEKENIYLGYFFIILTLVFLVLIFSRNQLREKGIFYHGTLYSWKRIASYRWNIYQETGLFLTIEYNHRISALSGTREFQIPTEKKKLFKN